MPTTVSTESADEIVWITRAAGGDRAAYSLLVGRHQGRVRAQLRRLVGGDAGFADDLAQEAFVQAWLHLSEFRGEARFATWLYRIAYRRSLLHVRERGPLDLKEPSVESNAASIEPSHHPERLHALRIDMDRALQRLPAEEQAALIHCYHLDLTHDEAAVVLGLPPGTLKSQVARGKARLAKLLEAWAPSKTAHTEVSP